MRQRKPGERAAGAPQDFSGAAFGAPVGRVPIFMDGRCIDNVWRRAGAVEVLDNPLGERNVGAFELQLVAAIDTGKMHDGVCGAQHGR